MSRKSNNDFIWVILAIILIVCSIPAYFSSQSAELLQKSKTKRIGYWLSWLFAIAVFIAVIVLLICNP